MSFLCLFMMTSASVLLLYLCSMCCIDCWWLMSFRFGCYLNLGAWEWFIVWGLGSLFVYLSCFFIIYVRFDRRCVMIIFKLLIVYSYEVNGHDLLLLSRQSWIGLKNWLIFLSMRIFILLKPTSSCCTLLWFLCFCYFYLIWFDLLR